MVVSPAVAPKENQAVENKAVTPESKDSKAKTFPNKNGENGRGVAASLE